MDITSTWFENLIEDCTPGKHQEIKTDISWNIHRETSIHKQYEGCADTAWSRY
jgi:hypothetical protein